MLTRLRNIIALILIVLHLQAQDTTSVKIPVSYLNDVSAKAQGLEQKLDKKTNKSLRQMEKLEQRMKRKLMVMDSLKAKELFDNTIQRYKDLEQGLSDRSQVKHYIPSLDTLSTSLKFIEQNSQLVSQIKDGPAKLKEALSRIRGLENQFQKAEQIKTFLKERKQFLKDQLSKFGFAKEIKKLNKQVYYYSEQLNEYKALLKDHKKAEKKAIELLSKTKLFKNFMRKNSMLASLFRLPGDPNDPAAQAGLAGLQIRVQVNSLIQQQIAGGGPNAQQQFKENMQSAQSQLSQLKNKITQHGGKGSDDIIPEGFKPNDQKKNSFWKRLEYGTNVQTQRATNFFPVTSDIALSLGYKLNDRSVIGIGASYKLGLGRGWNDIRLSSQGAGLRSFIDWKIKGSFWISGGYEQNYKTAFNGFSQLRDLNAWQQSGLLGLSKIVSIKNKFFKKTKLQLLWDILSYQQVPRTQPVIFRIGYNLK
jgi:hypothetical protein